jgi:hypothetical protein
MYTISTLANMFIPGYGEEEVDDLDRLVDSFQGMVGRD